MWREAFADLCCARWGVLVVLVWLARQAGEWVTEGGGDDARAGGEVQVDEDGNEVEEEAQAEELGRMEAGIDLLQEDERLYLRFYKNLTLALGVALVACVGLVAWVVYNGGLQPSPSIQWRRLPAAICVALSASLDRNTLDSETAQRLRQVRPALRPPPPLGDSSIRRRFLDDDDVGVGVGGSQASRHSSVRMTRTSP